VVVVVGLGEGEGERRGRSGYLVDERREGRVWMRWWSL